MAPEKKYGTGIVTVVSQDAVSGTLRYGSVLDLASHIREDTKQNIKNTFSYT